MLRLFDTFAGKKKTFRPLKDNVVRIYTCGPSVYNYSHIGNFRTYLFEDVLVRYLLYKGYRVKRVMNITDVEDKAIVAARRENVSLAELESEKTRAFFRDWNALGMTRPDVVAKASEHVPQMIRMIRRICARGYCLDGRDGIYFNVRKFKAYGSLRRIRKRTYFGKAKGDDYAWEGLWDFRLWKRWTRGDGNVRWSSPFGYGRPGWHIECSAMSIHYLGERFDIHCGGTDNIYPHHENEIAQSKAAYGKMPAAIWMHAKHLTLDKKKMSKRSGNVLHVKDLTARGVRPKCLRFYLLSLRYRRPLDFSMKQFRHDVCDCERTRKLMERLSRLKAAVPDLKMSGNGKKDGRKGERIAKNILQGFESAMDDDMNTGLAFRRIFQQMNETEKQMQEKKLSRKDAVAIVNAMGKIDTVLGVF